MEDDINNFKNKNPFVSYTGGGGGWEGARELKFYSTL